MYCNFYIYICTIFTGYRVSDQELRAMVKEVDEDGDGEIDFDEFVKMMNNVTKQMESREGADLREAFKVCLWRHHVNNRKYSRWLMYFQLFT